MTGLARATLRRARSSDCELVWSIHNEPAVRQNSTHREPIPLADHRAWFAARLADPACVLQIAEVDAQPIGVLRFGCADGLAVISIALAAAWRGRGLGAAIIASATSELLDGGEVRAVLARIRPDNAASQRAFRKAGYAMDGRTLEAGVELLQFRCARPVRVLLRCDGGPSIGWGHAIRCSALATALRQQRIGTSMLMSGPEPALLRHLEGMGETVSAIDGGDDVAATIDAIGSLGARALVLDSYRLGRAYLDAVHAATGVPRIVIDDLADRELRCEAVINANPWASDQDLARFGATTRLRGPSFALLRSEFLPERRPERSPAAEPQVLVTLGGSALGLRAVDLARAIDALDRPLRIALLLGPSNEPAIAAAREFTAHGRHPIDVHIGLPKVAELFARSTLAVSAAGTTCFELATLGVPGLLLIAADNQERGGAAWSALGAFDCLGRLDDVAPRDLAARVAEALNDRAGLESRSRRGMATVPGDGAGRAARALDAAFALSPREPQPPSLHD